MSKNKRKKSMNWYDLHHRFSIRKYHFGAASVLLGVALALTGGAEVSATTTDTSASTTPSSVVETTSSAMTDTSVSKTPSSTTEPTTPISDASTATSTSETTSSSAIEEVTTTTTATERVATIEYTVEYQDESGKAVASTVKSVETKTTDKTAIATVTETATVPAGYELVANEMTTSTTGVVEGANTKVVFKVVKKVAADTASTTTSSSTTDEPATTPATTSTVAAPTTVAEVKVNLEQNISEAQVLSDEANRLYTASPEGNEALKIVADATKLAATKATAVFENSVATLEEVNAQITAVRTNVDALVLELRKYYPDGEITAVLNTAAGTPAATTIDVTNPRSIYYAQNGVWEIPDPAKAANSGLPVADQQATITEADRNYPDGYNGDQEADRDTFLILNLDTVAGYGDGQNFNDWVKHNYYITFSVSTNAAERASEDVVYAKLVEKTDNGNNVVRTIKLAPGVANNFEELKVLEGDTAHKTTYSFVYNVQKNGGTTRTITINNSNGVNKNAFLYSKLEPKRVGERFTTASASVTGSTTQTTSYFVKENADTGRPRELLAKYTQTGGLIGDKFSIAGAIDFDNYELIKSELPSVTSGVLASDYIVGTQTLQVQPNNNEVRVVTITGADGSIQQQLYMLDPNNPDWAKFYKSNMNKATLSDLKDYFKLMFTSEVLKPGTYNTKEGTFSAKFYEADKLVLENTIVQVLDENGNVLGTLSDDKSTITTNAGTTISVASATDSLVKGTDETVYLLNYLKVYKTDTNGNYVDADGNVLDPIKWRVTPPSNPFVEDVYAKESFDTDTVTIATGPLDANSYPEAIWYFGYNYKTADGETRLVDTGVIPGATDSAQWDLGGKELGMRNSNSKNEQHARYWYTEKGGVEVYYITSDGKVLTDFTTSDGKTVADKVTIVGHGDTDSAYDITSVRYPTITAADGTVYYYKQIDTTAANLHPVVNDTTDTDYRSIEKIDGEKGTIKTDTVKQLTYVYEKAGNVNVHYVDTDGNELQPSVEDVTNGKPGTGYDTVLDNKQNEITVNGLVYYLVPAGEYKVGTVGDENNLTVVGNGKATGIDATTGTVDAGVTKNVTYVYQKGGDVIVNYVDQDGNPISGTTDKGTTTESTVTDTSYTKAGTAYNTTDLKPTTITTTDGKVYQLVPEATKGNEDGKVESGVTKEVTYVYKEVKGSVVVNYISTTGEEIQAQVVDTPESSTGTEYDTTDVKPETITTKDGRTFKLVPKLTQGSEKGEVVPGVTEVTYVYEEVKGDVVVNYVNTDGKVIATQVVDTKTTSTGTAYDTTDNKPEKIVEDATGDVYYYKEVQAGSNETGKVVEGTTEVTYVYEKAGNVVVNYITEDGTVIKAPVQDETNVPAGKSYDTTDNKPVEIVTEDGSRYVLIPSKTVGSETGTVEGGKTTEITYVYKKVANWVPQIPGVPEGQEPKVPYPFDPTNPDVPVTPTPDTVIPNVPGYTPVDPKDNTPLKPVDPTDPGKGYVPPTPDDSGVDTPIPYVQNGNVVVNYVTEDGTVIKTPVNDETDVPAGKSYDTTDNKPTEIVTEDGSRYVLIPSKTVGSETGTVEGGKTTEITYVYKKVANWVPQIPGVPENERPVIPYPFDPNNPDVPVTPTPDTVIPNVPGYTPVDPKDNTPLKPVDPNDPGKGYVPPTPEKPGEDTLIPYVQNGNVVVNYVTEDGTVIKAPVQDETNVPAGKSYDTTDNKPTEIVIEDGSRYVLIPSKTIGTENGTVEGGKTTEITYVYKKVANWIPEIPGVPENERPVIPYPFDPNNPDVPITPTPDTVIPNVPGYTPVDPKDNTPLKPVDPNDPGKGYVPPTPEKPGEDTLIPYVQNGNVVVNYVTEDGTVIKAPVQDETNVPAGKSYDTTDNKPTEIVTEDGTTYELVRVDGSETGTVEGGKTTEVTYVYRKVTPAKKVVTNHVDEDGNPIAPQEEGTTPNKSIPGYEFTGKTITDKDGNTTHIYRKINNSVKPTPPTTDTPSTPKPNVPMKASGVAQLPNTGESSSSVVTALGAGMLLASLGLVGKRRKDSEE
ncbi:LPXTG cell wall anchor domain-containing protein [Streptococcus suis]|nr:LPXTG cell wall anchor domain-containing protein [Streptococcus suis]